MTSLVLMAAWLLPDVWQSNLVFPISKLDTLRGLDFLAALSRPVAGALCLTLVALPIGRRFCCLAATPLLLAALGFPAAMTPSAGSGIAAALAVFSIPIALIAFVVLKTEWGGHITLMLVPAALLALVLRRVASSEIPPSLLAAYKAPLELWALTFGITVCLGNLLFTARKSHSSR